MKNYLIISGLVAAGLAATPALATEGTATGAAGGAITGAIVGGPVGAAVGGVIGAIAGTAVDPPPQEVVTYVRAQPMPAEPMTLEGEVAVGAKLPEQVVLVEVPEDPTYAYAFVNGHRVIVDPKTYVIVGVAD
ncbi:DUF1236 domain-containing protein [Rhizobium sp. L1K21]|uniref:DUF1236 domain-containing protein n=1 Tax=Rhizobium sp. L1K21 TaxID=2954933 RepID=UPI002093B277|nr:DUF1236 domain-containing protein [Rhizobium sp. L1K21]MCO6186601.1 DUF1236 domain-containing protein [Rhizobium sp. L1K21]